MPNLKAAARTLARQSARAFPDMCTIQDRVQTPDGAGGTTTTWADRPEQPCRVNNPTTEATERLSGGQVVSEVDRIIALASGTEVDATNRIVVHGMGTFEVSGVLDWSYQTEAKVAAKELT